MTITLQRVEAVAPDQASLNAARKLLKAPSWPELAHDAPGELLWGTCQGSGATPYRVAVEVSDLGAKCSCPSRKFPCKHALALMWWQVEQPEKFVQAVPPQWIGEWLARRRKPDSSARPPTAGAAAPEAPRSAAAAHTADTAVEVDPQRAARARERSRAARERSIAAGLDELDLWLSDQLERGLGAFASDALARCRLLSQRLVDAKAGGIAGRIEQLSAGYFALPEAQRPGYLLEVFGSMHLLAEAYRRQDKLTPDACAEVRRLVGWPQARDELLRSPALDRAGARPVGTGADGALTNSPQAQRVSDEWVVAAVVREAQPDKLLRYDSWLVRKPGGEGPKVALLQDFVPLVAAASSAPSLEAGTTITAELVFYPSATPLRALMASQLAVTRDSQLPDPGCDLSAALDTYDARVTSNPWLSAWPVGASQLSVRADESGQLWALDAQQSAGVPLLGERAAPLHGLTGITLYGAYDGRALQPLAADTTLGGWWNAGQ